MRSILLTMAILLIAYIVRTDLSEGTLSRAAFYHPEENCEEQTTIKSVSVQIHEGDTLQSLFALHPSPVEYTFLERLAYFYELNPHLRKQPLVPGDTVSLPIMLEKEDSCLK